MEYLSTLIIAASSSFQALSLNGFPSYKNELILLLTYTQKNPALQFSGGRARHIIHLLLGVILLVHVRIDEMPFHLFHRVLYQSEP